MKYKLLAALLVITLYGCNGDNAPKESEATEETPQPKIAVPAFNADNAYSHIEKQVSFGPRVPGTAAQKQCADWMLVKLKEVCDTVYQQRVKVKSGDGKMLPCINLIGSINPGATRRILLLTHWDSRPWSDMDMQVKDKPVIAADDGGSGVGVLIELARVIKENKLPAELGIDILFTDVEDYGKTEWGEDSYCLGTQYWARNPHTTGYKAEFGILLDMVGAANATFPMEQVSAQYAGNIQQQIWEAASTAGYKRYFPSVQGPGITDDHIYVNKLTGIPTVDIINMDLTGGNVFAKHWHTQQDNMMIIDKSTLKAVGQTLLQLIYEKAKPAI